MVTIVDQSRPLNASGGFGDGSLEFFGQTFVAAESRLNSLEFYLGSTAGDVLNIRVLITTVAPSADGFHPGTVLFETGVAFSSSSGGYTPVTIDTGSLPLTAGATYAFVLDAWTDRDSTPTEVQLAVSNYSGEGVAYTQGHLVSLDYSDAGPRTAAFADDWNELSNGYDMGFKLVFSTPQTILGGKGKDFIDAGHTPSGQPFPGGFTDLIFGLGGNDVLFGVGGDDLLSGGKGKDRLYGGDGKDQFQFDAGLKQPADKIMDFNPVDDTVVLAATKFKALFVGVLPDLLFVDLGEKATSDAGVIYKASGKLQYDKDGKGGADPITFAKLIGAPDISAADILVV